TLAVGPVRMAGGGARGSLGLDGLDDGPPLLDFGFVECAEGFGRLLVLREYLLAEVSEPTLHARISQSTRNSSIELSNDVLRRARRCPQPEPRRKVQPGQTRLVQRRDIGFT